MAGRPRKNQDTEVLEKPKKNTGVPKMENPPPPPKMATFDNSNTATTEGLIENSNEAHGVIEADVLVVPEAITHEEVKAAISTELSQQLILRKYEEKCAHQSDINELLPLIREVASHCPHCTEMGVRNPTSTYAILAGNPSQLISYDLVRHENVSEVEAIAPNFKFVLGNSLEVEIDETDMLLIDTHHRYAQLKAELERHSHKVRKYIVMHDSVSFGFRDESAYEDQPQQVYGNGPGLMPAITEFLQQGTFKIDFHAEYNNGLMILRRVK